MAEKKLFLLDAMALIYRAHFAFIKAPRITAKGLNTSAVFGFSNTLLEILAKEKPSHLAVAFDTPEPTFRHVEYKEYKAQREEIPEDIVVAIPLVKRLLKSLNIPLLEKPGFEADDLIGTLAKKAEREGYQVFMVTPDKDFAQLVTNDVFLYKPARAGNGIEILDPAGVERAMGILPERVTDFLGLKGDAVDNIPGIPKVGDKTAIELINEFGTVEEIINQAEKIQKKSIRESVLENAEKGLLSKRLATIKTDIELPWEEEDLQIGNPDREAFLSLMNELEFRNIATRILQSAIFGNGEEVETQKDLFGNSISSPKQEIDLEPQIIDHGYATLDSRIHNYSLLDDEAAILAFSEKAKNAGVLCFDTETTDLDPMVAEIVAITFSIQPNEAFLVYFPPNDQTKKSKLKAIKALLEFGKILKIGQNLKFDMLLLRNYDIEVAGPFFDTMIASYVINPDRSHGMDALSRDFLKYDPVSISSLIGKKGKQQLSMRDVSLEKLIDYACEDADITLCLKNELAPLIIKDELNKVFEEIEIPLIPVLTEMEFAGIKIDSEALAIYSVELEKEMAITEKEIFTLAGQKFNINSPKQLGEILFDKLKIGKAEKTKTGQYSTREEVLTELAAEHEMPAKILRFRQFGKLKSTYVDALPLLVNSKTGRVHTTYAQAVAATGRLSSNNPNIQNIPIRTEEGREIRKAFIPEAGNKLISADYSQIELRLMAEFSADEGMREAFMQGEDIHKATASKVFDVPLGEVNHEMRGKAKMVNFGIIYGISAFGLAQRLGISRTESSEIIRSYFEKYPGVKKYMDQSIEFAREKGYATTYFGRRRYLPDINSRNQTSRGFAERNAINTPIQGSAAELIKVAMVEIHKEMRQKRLKSKLLLQVHDELVFEVPGNEIDLMSKLVKERMENAIKFTVPMLVEVGVGNNWLEAH